MSFEDYFAIILAVVGMPLVLIGVPIFLLGGGLQKFAKRPLEHTYRGIELHQSPQPGDVSFAYHTYRGFLLWFVQEKHRVIAPADQARQLLKRLLRFNLTWGMLSYGFLFVPIMALGNYYAQIRSIDRQLITNRQSTN